MADKSAHPELQISSKQKEEQDEAKFSDLYRKVMNIVNQHSWLEIYGPDWLLLSIVSLLYVSGYLMLRTSCFLAVVGGIFTQAIFYTVISVRGGHSASHRTLCRSRWWNNFWGWLFMDVVTKFPFEVSVHAHVKMHHAYTNVIGLGDSSTFRAPFLSAVIYLFVAPFAIPVLTVLAGLHELWGKWRRTSVYLLTVFGTYWLEWHLMAYVCGFSFAASILYSFLSRALFSIPYIHVNIFQHIGLQFYTKDKRPPRINQMSHSVLNLTRCSFLNVLFGDSIVSCHIEHHLFPTLSNSMCQRVKSTVKKYMQEHGLPYTERTYWNRLKLFLNKYEDLMVKAPSLISCVGLQS